MRSVVARREQGIELAMKTLDVDRARGFVTYTARTRHEADENTTGFGLLGIGGSLPGFGSRAELRRSQSPRLRMGRWNHPSHNGVFPELAALLLALSHPPGIALYASGLSFPSQSRDGWGHFDPDRGVLCLDVFNTQKPLVALDGRPSIFEMGRQEIDFGALRSN